MNTLKIEFELLLDRIEWKFDRLGIRLAVVEVELGAARDTLAEAKADLMRARTRLAEFEVNLDSARAEAVAAWIEKEATENRQRMGEYYERSVEGMLEEAAAIRAGKVGGNPV